MHFKFYDNYLVMSSVTLFTQYFLPACDYCRSLPIKIQIRWQGINCFVDVFPHLLKILHVYSSFACSVFHEAEVSHGITVQIQVQGFLNERYIHFHHGAFEMEPNWFPC